MKSIVLIGDSIRMGYQQYVAKELEGRADLWWPELNGSSSSNVLANLEEWVVARRPDVVHVNDGLHDIRRPFSATRGPAENQVPVEEYRRNIETLFSRLLIAAPQVIWATTTPVIYERHHATKAVDRFEEDVREYNRVAVDIARGKGIAIDDLYETVMKEGHTNLLGPDGCHFTEEGYALLGKTVADYLDANCGL